MKRIVMGIDPGLSCTGFGILAQEGNRIQLIDCGTLRFSSAKPLTERVSLFHDEVALKIKNNGVSILSIETPFLGKNAQNFLKLGYLRGILYFLAHKNNMSLKEFSPCEVKKQVAGVGLAQKEQVAYVVARLFPGLQPQKTLDATDALAVALCGLWHQTQK